MAKDVSQISIVQKNQNIETNDGIPSLNEYTECFQVRIEIT